MIHREPSGNLSTESNTNTGMWLLGNQKSWNTSLQLGQFENALKTALRDHPWGNLLVYG